MRNLKIHLLHWAASLGQVDSTSRLVLVKMVLYMDADRVARVTRSRLSGELGLSEAAVKQAVRRLRDARLVSTRREGGMWVYVVTEPDVPRRWHDVRPMPPV